MRLFLGLVLLLEVSGRKGSGSKGSSSSSWGSSSGSSWSSSSNKKPSSSSSLSSSLFGSSKPTTSSGNKYSYNGVSNSMKSKGWSSKIKKAAGAYLAIKAAKKFRPKLWTGYGYEGDDYYRDYSEIERCFSCRSVGGDNEDCERPDGSFLISSIPTVACSDTFSYCGLAITELNGVTYFERGCYPKTHLMQNQCPNIIEPIASMDANDVVDQSVVQQTYCDYCDSNGCNGWTLRALPDEAFASGSILALSLVLLFAIFM